MCRSQSIVTVEDGKKVKLEAYTTGLGILPKAGGLEDQSHRMMIFFEEFISGDRIGFSNNLKRK